MSAMSGMFTVARDSVIRDSQKHKQLVINSHGSHKQSVFYVRLEFTGRNFTKDFRIMVGI